MFIIVNKRNTNHSNQISPPAYFSGTIRFSDRTPLVRRSFWRGLSPPRARTPASTSLVNPAGNRNVANHAKGNSAHTMQIFHQGLAPEKQSCRAPAVPPPHHHIVSSSTGKCGFISPLQYLKLAVNHQFAHLRFYNASLLTHHSSAVHLAILSRQTHRFALSREALVRCCR